MKSRPPRYLSFARALALLAASATTAAASGCEVVGQAVGCDHCYCGPAGLSVSQPVSCRLVANSHCCTPMEGPLPPPDLPA